MKLAGMTVRLIGQPMFKLLAKANELERQGKDIIHFEIGDPDFDSPDKAIDAAISSMRQGETHYTNSMGILEFRQAVIRKVKEDYGFSPDLEQVLISPANSVIDFVIRCVADPGDEIIIPDPGFPTYLAAASYAGMKTIGVPLKEKAGFRMNPDDVGRAITPKTRLIIINSPNNPTGSVMDKKEALAIGLLAKKYNIFLLSDEVYFEIVYGEKFHSPCVLDRCKTRTILLKSMSKVHAMSGWRMGYAVGPSKLINKMGLLLQTILSCLPAFTQRASVAALKECDELAETRRRILEERRDILVNGLNRLEGVSCVAPKGAYYVFPNITRTRLTAQEFSNKMLARGVCVLSGDCFGRYGKGYVRLSYASTPVSKIREALKRMRG